MMNVGDNAWGEKIDGCCVEMGAFTSSGRSLHRRGTEGRYLLMNGGHDGWSEGGVGKVLCGYGWAKILRGALF